MNLFKIFLLVLLFSNVFQKSYSQTKAFFFDKVVDSVLFNYKSANSTDVVKNMYFPYIEMSEKVLEIGFDLLKYRKVNWGNNVTTNKRYHISMNLDQGIKININTSIYIRSFIENIKSYAIYIYSQTDSSWYSKSFNVNYPLYQMGLSINLSEFRNPSDGSGKNLIPTKKDSRTITKLVLLVDNHISSPVYIIGELKIRNTAWKKNYNIYEPILEKYTQTENRKNNSLTEFSNSPYVVTGFSFYNYFQYSGSLHFDFDSINLFRDSYQIIYALLENYPFYSVRNINKGVIIERYKKFKGLNYDLLIDSTISLVSEFHDPHFYIRKPIKKSSNNNSSIRPFSVFHMEGRIVISGIFDTTLISKIDIGDEVISFNDKPIDLKLIDSISNNYKGEYLSRKTKALSNLFKGNQEDSIVIVVKKAQPYSYDKYPFINIDNLDDVHVGIYDTHTVTVICKRENILIPPNFYPKHCDFRMYDNIAYYRINRMFNDSWIRFLNNINDLKDSKGIVFDLRGNGGGDELTVLNFISLFINKPIITKTCEIEGSRETFVLNNHSRYYFDIPITILVDERTACASETFAYYLKKYSNAVIIGRSRTAGTYARVSRLFLPKNVIVNNNSFLRESLMNNQTFETNGIEPDIYVRIKEYNDLFPYEDKVRKVALKYLQAFDN